MAGSPGLRGRRKRALRRYHHGDLQRALLEEALRTIQSEGLEHLTLRAVGKKLGVSRTALYRHFSDKQALLAAVGREGFRRLRSTLTDARHQSERGRELEALGIAYVRFAVIHSAHYRVMFGRFGESCSRDAAFLEEATSAFKVLVTLLGDLRRDGFVRRDDPILLARFIWSLLHGIAMLVIDGQLRGLDERGEALSKYALERIRDAIDSAGRPRPLTTATL